MNKRILKSIFIATILTLGISLILMIKIVFDISVRTTFNQLKVDSHLAKVAVEKQGISYLNALELRGYRVTWVDQNGKVLFDNGVSDVDLLENHIDRKEIQEAIQFGQGQSVRYSNTLLRQSLYVATRLTDQTILRFSTSQNTAIALLLRSFQPIALVLILGFIISYVLAKKLSKNITKPINQLNLEEPLQNKTYEELSPILLRLHNQKKEISKRIDAIKQKEEEFETITQSLQEGLLIVNEQKNILLLNQSAKHLLSISAFTKNQSLLEVTYNFELNNFIEQAFVNPNLQQEIRLNEKSYLMHSSPIYSDNALQAIAIVFFDITSHKQNELLRREFTANVSHELKTPLHIILGYLELLKKGMVKQEDKEVFIERIYDQSLRLSKLIQDLIELSKLDEGKIDDVFSDLLLKEIVDNVFNELHEFASSRNIRLHSSLQNQKIKGVSSLIYTIVYNLVENAIKYNKIDGDVWVSFVDNQLIIKDNGIGIEDHEKKRIFERFYRIDKSHSKKIEGNGLGLSIVKHALLVHRAQIEVLDRYNGGTVFKITFKEDNLDIVG